MASIRPHRDKWRAQIFLLGVRESAVFRTKREAFAWASARETEIRNAAGSAKAERHTVADALRSYATEVSPGKRGRRWEEIRLAALERAPNFPAGLLIDAVDTSHLAAWRDARLLQVSPGTVLREVALLSAVFETARREWKWITTNPFSDLRRPRAPRHRDVVFSGSQIRRMLRALDWRRGKCSSTRQAVGRAFMLSLRTGMRAGEICGLTWANVREDYCILPMTKTTPRDVPLTWAARRLIESMREWNTVTVFGVSADTRDTTFRRAKLAAGLSGLTFHDARHTAATRLATQLDVLTLCKVFGWTNPKQALTYYNPTASQIATRLSAQRRPVRSE